MPRSMFGLLTIALVAGATACHHAQPALPGPAPMPPAAPATVPPRFPASPPAPPPAPALATPGPSPDETVLSEDDVFRRKSIDQLNAEQPLTDAFFDFDQSVLRPDARESLDRDAHWLRRWTQVRAEIEGYCDERGTNEYNLALGDRRARAARDYLVELGVDPVRLTIVSYGKERGFCHESTEACWAQNRRGHFVITAK